MSAASPGSAGSLRLAALLLAAVVALGLCATPPAEAGEGGWWHSGSAGVLSHDPDGLWSGYRREHGVDLNAELSLARATRALGGGVLRPYVGVSWSTAGDTSKLYSGYALEVASDWGGFARIGLGAAVHDGKLETTRSDRKELGARVLFHIPLELGFTLRERHRLSLYFDHVSNAGLASENEGLDTLGLRYGVLF